VCDQRSCRTKVLGIAHRADEEIKIRECFCGLVEGQHPSREVNSLLAQGFTVKMRARPKGVHHNIIWKEPGKSRFERVPLPWRPIESVVAKLLAGAVLTPDDAVDLSTGPVGAAS